MPAPADPLRLRNTRRFLMSFSTQRPDDAADLLEPDIVYTVAGRNPFAGVFHGPTEVEHHLARLFDFSSGTFDVLKWVDWMVGEDHVAALQYAQVQGHGAIYRGHHLFVVRCAPDGLLADIRVFFEDQERADFFLSM